MKKALKIMLAVLVLISMAACTAKQEENKSYPVWRREGYFSDEAGDMLSITWSDTEGYEGWMIGFMIEGDFDKSYGNIIHQEKDTLHGNIVPDYEEGEFVVTITEEGEDGVQVVVDGGETYHLVAMEIEEAPIVISINTDGYGYFTAISDDKEAYQVEEDIISSAILSLYEPTTYVLTARPGDEQWKFSKWTRNGEDLSDYETIEIEFTESADYVAVFEFAD